MRVNLNQGWELDKSRSRNKILKVTALRKDDELLKKIQQMG